MLLCALVAATVCVRACTKLSLLLSSLLSMCACVCMSECVNRWSCWMLAAACFVQRFFWHCAHSSLRVLLGRSCVSPRAYAPPITALSSASQRVNSVSIVASWQQRRVRCVRVTSSERDSYLRFRLRFRLQLRYGSLLPLNPVAVVAPCSL